MCEAMGLKKYIMVLEKTGFWPTLAKVSVMGR